MLTMKFKSLVFPLVFALSGFFVSVFATTLNIGGVALNPSTGYYLNEDGSFCTNGTVLFGAFDISDSALETLIGSFQTNAPTYKDYMTLLSDFSQLGTGGASGTIVPGWDFSANGTIAGTSENESLFSAGTQMYAWVFNITNVGEGITNNQDSFTLETEWGLYTAGPDPSLGWGIPVAGTKSLNLSQVFKSDSSGYLLGSRASSNPTVGSYSVEMVGGSQPVYKNLGNLYVGSNSSSVSISISSGSTNLSNTYVGYSSKASKNLLNISGENTVLENIGDVFVGYAGADNRMVVSGGGMLLDVNGVIGSSNSSSNNTVRVTGSNSIWSNTGTLTVGNDGSGALTVSEGGKLVATGMSIANSTKSIGTLNFGSFGGADTVGTISVPTIGFGRGKGIVNFNQANTCEVSSAISGHGSLNQLGAGTTVLTGSNTFSGGTTVSLGTLEASSLGEGFLKLGSPKGKQAEFVDTVGSGTMSVGSLSLTGNSLIEIENPYSTIMSSKVLSVYGINNLIKLSGVWTNPGDYELFSASKVTGGGLRKLKLGGSFLGGADLALDGSTNYEGLTFTFTNSDTALELKISSLATPAVMERFDARAGSYSAQGEGLSIHEVPEPSNYSLSSMGLCALVTVMLLRCRVNKQHNSFLVYPANSEGQSERR